MNKFTLVLDSSQISTYLECPMLWYYQNVKHLMPSFLSVQDTSPMNAGTYGHKLLDLYYRNRFRGLNLNDAAAAAFSYNPDTDSCECGCSLDSHKLIPLLNIRECHRCKHCYNFKAKPFTLDMQTRIAVQNRLREYFYTYQSNDFSIPSQEYVEVGFSEPIFENDEDLFVLEGRIDLLPSLQGLDCIVDHKFQMRRHQLYSKSVQFRNYALVAKRKLLIINYIRLAKAASNENLVRELVNFTVPELLDWKQKLIHIFRRVKQTILDAENGIQPVQNWSACPGRFNYQCNYTQLCEEPQQAVRDLKEKQLYQINPNPWRPW